MWYKTTVGKAQCKLKHCCIEEPFWQDKTSIKNQNLEWDGSTVTIYCLNYAQCLLLFLESWRKTSWHLLLKLYMQDNVILIYSAVKLIKKRHFITDGEHLSTPLNLYSPISKDKWPLERKKQNISFVILPRFYLRKVSWHFDWLKSITWLKLLSFSPNQFVISNLDQCSRGFPAFYNFVVSLLSFENCSVGNWNYLCNIKIQRVVWCFQRIVGQSLLLKAMSTLVCGFIFVGLSNSDQC